MVCALCDLRYEDVKSNMTVAFLKAYKHSVSTLSYFLCFTNYFVDCPLGASFSTCVFLRACCFELYLLSVCVWEGSREWRPVHMTFARDQTGLMEWHWCYTQLAVGHEKKVVLEPMFAWNLTAALPGLYPPSYTCVLQSGTGTLVGWGGDTDEAIVWCAGRMYCQLVILTDSLKRLLWFNIYCILVWIKVFAPAININSIKSCFRCKLKSSCPKSDTLTCVSITGRLVIWFRAG